ncbi:thiamine diphosphokinase [Heyndrickxia acidiproducens]|uniref:thiamine diphosphokinase n=1 Tax=Heyndrickxia acidiproducens TaxID=1121084 RepID=UPI000362A015|nr:thiamine diphosphokinase [Heyndrickxia acidiproducens]
MAANIHIVAGGPLENVPDLKSCAESENVSWIGCDRGVVHLLQLGIVPDMAFGDFDSVNAEEWRTIQNTLTNIKKFKPEKDETDLELALLWAIRQNPRAIKIFGATGGRADHALTNMMLLTHEKALEYHGMIEIIDRMNRISVCQPGIYTIGSLQTHPYISFLPITATVENLTLSGFKYPLQDRKVYRGSTLCISNELIRDFGTFSFTDGILMMIRSHD